MGTVYLLHFDKPIGNPNNRRAMAQHYLGFTGRGFKERLARHLRGDGARIVAAFVKAGCVGRLARKWTGGRLEEKKLKGRKNSRQLCPICREETK